MLMVLILVTSGCGRNEQSPSVAPDVQGRGQQSVATPTIREVFLFETEVAIAVATEQVQTAPPLPPATFPPPPTLVPEAVTTDCQPLDDFIPRNCWRSEQRGIGIQAGFRDSNPRQGAVQFFARGMEIHDTPTQVGLVKLRTVNYPYATVFTGTIEFTFNLETRQWVTANGSPTLTDPQKGATEEARQVMYDEAVRNDSVTLTALAIPTLDPASTMEPINDIPAPTRGFGIFSAFECSGEPKPKPTFLSNNCWHGQLNSQDVYVTAGREGLADDPNQPVQGGIRVKFYIRKYEVDENIHWTPTKSGTLEIMSVNGSVVNLRSVTGTTFTFNLETRQWMSDNGTPIASTPTATPIGQ